MGLVINPRGTSGAGKTWLVREVMAAYCRDGADAVPLCRKGRPRPMGWSLCHRCMRGVEVQRWRGGGFESCRSVASHAGVVGPRPGSKRQADRSVAQQPASRDAGPRHQRPSPVGGIPSSMAEVVHTEGSPRLLRAILDNPAAGGLLLMVVAALALGVANSPITPAFAR